ncbi:hypothetical protein L3X38_008714 [Prunus dulcis]|uniref:non-specific serine/threonine protein kinase n=1 Tax=Prunus dulcis TaxID=3755 RepID=A0AAD5F795_PRUDU|nr:hypothetical protein L3X38_008714 [Prunus dulcis]
MVVRKVGKYEVGRTIGEGTFAKVKFAQNTETGESVAMKVLDRTTIIKHKMVDQIKREISIMKLVRHPYVVRLHEVLASRTKIYIILEFITGGELFDKIVHHGRLSEGEARRYFHQLIDGVDYCHSKGVYHRDLKPENLLLDSLGNLKISDFGLSALPEQGVSLLRTTCGTPNYVAPEVLSHKGYDGAVADVWSCGVILYVLMAGYLPFDELDLTTLYSKIEKAEFSCPSWFPVGAKSLIHRILDPNPETRITIEQIRDHEWFQKNYVPVRSFEYEDVNLDDVNAVFDDADSEQEQRVSEHRGNEDMGPLVLNAFDLIILSQGLNLATMFDRGKGKTDSMKYQTRFVSQKPAKVVLSSMEVVAQSMGFKTHIRNYKMRVEGLSANKTSHFSIILEIFEVAPTYYMVDIQKAAGDASEFLKFYKNFCSNLEDIIWKPPTESSKSRLWLEMWMSSRIQWEFLPGKRRNGDVRVSWNLGQEHFRGKSGLFSERRYPKLYKKSITK